MQEDIINDFQKLMKPERNVSERVSDSFDTDIFQNVKDKRKKRMSQTGQENLREYVDAISRRSFDLPENEISFLKQVVDVINKPEHKNPTAYILGYLTFKDSNKDGTINKKFLDNLEKKVLPTLEDRSVTIPDVIRYTRLWMNLEGVEK